MRFPPLVNTLQFLQGVNARETCTSFWTGRKKIQTTKKIITPLAFSAFLCDNIFDSGAAALWISGHSRSGDLPRNHCKWRFRSSLERRKKMGIASLVLGIVGLVFACIPCLWLWSLFLTVPGLILGLIGLSKAKKAGTPKGSALGGVICSIIGIAISLIWLLIVVVFATA